MVKPTYAYGLALLFSLTLLLGACVPIQAPPAVNADDAATTTEAGAEAVAAADSEDGPPERGAADTTSDEDGPPERGAVGGGCDAHPITGAGAAADQWDFYELALSGPVYVNLNGQWQHAMLTGRQNANYRLTMDDGTISTIPMSQWNSNIISVDKAVTDGITANTYDVCSSAGQNQLIEAHNAARREVGKSDLVWDTALAQSAQDHVDQMRSWTNGNQGCGMQNVHNCDGIPENIVGAGYALTTAGAVKSWVDEKNYYNAATGQCQTGEICGHYTTVIGNFTKVGCAILRSPSRIDGSTVYEHGESWVCQYG